MKKIGYPHLTLLLAIVPFLFSSCTEEQAVVVIPTADQVGAWVMPETIAPIENAPFDIPSFQKPVFPDLMVNITDRGATENEWIHAIVNAVISEVSAKGGGTVVVPAGRWKSGRIILKSNVNLHIAEGAEVEFSGFAKDYLPAVFTRHEGIDILSAGAFIYAEGENNIAVTGKGVIWGPPLDAEIRRLTDVSLIIEHEVPAAMPLAERLFDGQDGRGFQPPKSISPVNCTNVFIEGVTINRSALWNIVPTYCEHVIIRGVTVNSVGIPRSDGIDIESSKNVLIEYTTLNCGDDCFTLKSGRGEDGLQVGRPTENVVIRWSLALHGPGAITCGSETAGNIRNIYAHDCVFSGTRNGILFKTRRPRGGGTENIFYERIRMTDVENAISWDLLGSERWVGDLAKRYPAKEINALTPVLRGIHIRDFIVESSRNFITAHCIPEIPLRNVLIENGEVNTEALIPALYDVEGFTLRNLTVNSQENKINILHGKDILFEEVKFTTSDQTIDLSMDSDSESIVFRNAGKERTIKESEKIELKLITN